MVVCTTPQDLKDGSSSQSSIAKCYGVGLSRGYGCAGEKGPDRQGAPVLIWPVARPTARSAMKLSSVSPERWEAMTPQPASFAIFTAMMDSVTVPIWFTCARRNTLLDAAV